MSQERTQSRPAAERTGGGAGGFIAGDDAADPLVTVASGLYSENLPVAGATVGEIRHRFSLRFDIDPRSQAVLDGRDVGDDVRVRPGQVLTFAHRAGEKGGGRR